MIILGKKVTLQRRDFVSVATVWNVAEGKGTRLSWQLFHLKDPGKLNHSSYISLGELGKEKTKWDIKGLMGGNGVEWCPEQPPKDATPTP